MREREIERHRERQREEGIRATVIARECVKERQREGID